MTNVKLPTHYKHKAVTVKAYRLLSGELVSLAGMNRGDLKFLGELSSAASGARDYFELLRKVKGPGARPLRGKPITPAIASSTLYRVAHDIADRVGIAQGYLLDPAVTGVDRSFAGEGLLSLTEAARLIGITRPAAHQAVTEGRLRGHRVGNAWIVTTADAEAFRASRRAGSGRRPARTKPPHGSGQRSAQVPIAARSARGNGP